MNRIIEPELLDTLPPADLRAVRSRRDLRRINWWMGNGTILTEALKGNLAVAPKHIAELGAGDGTLLFRVARKMPLAWLGVKVALLDHQSNVSGETLADFAGIGWRAEAVVADVFDWTPPEADATVMVANLFLHHFEDARLRKLLGKISRHATLFIAIEPHRFVGSSVVGQLLWLIGCNDVTRHDASISIRAGFAGQEISALWPDKSNWELTERRAGLFSHVFIARRRE